MLIRTALGLAALGAGALTLGGWSIAGTWHPAREHFPFQGVDVSEATGAVDWHEVKAAGADFAYARATSGAGVRDARFAEHWQDIEEAGLRRGAVHHFSTCKLASDQAANFVRTVPRDADALPAAIELELDDGCAAPARAVVLQEVATLLNAVETHTGKPALLKVARDFEQQYDLTTAIPRPIWSLQMAFPPSYAARPWRMWQANPLRRIKGVDRSVGWNVVAP
jgi:lysozyme